MSSFERVTLDTTANVYFDGLCTSHTFHTEDGVRKSAGVVELVGYVCHYR